ncbi:MAG: hypothetical protein V1760_00915 [Candidatus Peregrinibacteria bacterium]
MAVGNSPKSPIPPEGNPIFQKICQQLRQGTTVEQQPPEEETKAARTKIVEALQPQQPAPTPRHVAAWRREPVRVHSKES